MKTIILLFVALTFHAASYAQEGESLQKINEARRALINERLGLTPEQAEKFWPLYREYLQNKQALRAEFQAARSQAENREMTEAESKQLLEKGMQLKERQLELERTFNDRLTRFISSNQILLLRRAEEELRQLILQRLEKRGEQRERIERRQERKDNDQ